MSRSTLQRWVATGWSRAPEPPQRPIHVGQMLTPRPGAILGIFPTTTERFGTQAAAALRRAIVQQLAEVPNTALLVGVQTLDADPHATSAALAEELTDISHDNVPLGGFVLAGPGKLHSTNIGIAEAERIGADGLLLLDDDIVLLPGCLSALVEAFRAGSGKRALGARKLGRPHESLSGRTLFALKSLTQPATNYPHGCCMIVATEAVRGGLATHHHSDDGQILFRLLQPHADNPLATLMIVPDAECSHVVGGTLRATLVRLNRMLHHHAIAMADAPRESALWYFRNSLFYGLWPLAPFDASGGVPRGIAKLAVKAIYFTWFSVIVAKLVLRSAIGRPQSGVDWGDSGQFS